jgi:hypothetical protein
MKNPCTKDCPRRSPTCHSSCPDYPKYKKFLKHRKALIRKSKVYDDYRSTKIRERITKELKESGKKR